MNREEQIAEMEKIIKAEYEQWLDTTGVIPKASTYYAECLGCAIDSAETLYNVAGYRKIPENAVVLTKEEYIDLSRNYVTEQIEQVRKKTAKEIFQKVVNICRKEEDFQDGTVNTQLEPLYFGIMNGCAFIIGEVKELAEQYGVEVEE